MFFNHVDVGTEKKGEENVEIGEASLFLTSMLGDRKSGLAEITFDPSRDDEVKIERLDLRFEINENQFVSFGKVHIPTSYWNDTFHHGRVFFPTIDRPLAFSRFMPIHDTGVRWGGRSFGERKMFFDMFVGGGTNSDHENNLFGDGLNSKIVTFGLFPVPDWKLQLSAHKEVLHNHASNPWHMAKQSHHQANASTELHGSAHDELDFTLLSYSSHFENLEWRFLTEVSYNRTEGVPWNRSIYQYAGYKWTSDLTLYLYYDNTVVRKGDHHFGEGKERKLGIGASYFLSAAAVAKLEVIDCSSSYFSEEDGIMTRMQFAFGF